MTGAHPSERTTLLVTGANRGIGLELVRQALARGDRVFATCRDPDAASDLTALGTQHRDTLSIQQLDVSSDASVAAMAEGLGASRIDVLVNNAGIYGGERQQRANMDHDAWADAFAVNAMAPLRVAHAVMPCLRRSERPRIVTLTSIMGSMQNVGSINYAYSSSKAAANKVMTLLAQELRPEGIVVVPVHPGWVRTDMGGPGADLSAEQSARGLLAVIDGLTSERSGRFLSWDGSELPW